MTGPRIAELHVKQLIIEDNCPKCGEATATDCGGDFDGSDLPSEVEMGCDHCGIDWSVTVTMDVKAEDE